MTAREPCFTQLALHGPYVNGPLVLLPRRRIGPLAKATSFRLDIYVSTIVTIHQVTDRFCACLD